MDMKITITPKAKEYLAKSNTQNLFIEGVNIEQCCIPVVVPPIVRKGMPLVMPERFRQIESDGFTVHYDRSLPLKQEIIVDVRGVGFTKGLYISNWHIKF